MSNFCSALNFTAVLADVAWRPIFPLPGSAMVAGFFLSVSVILSGIWLARRTNKAPPILSLKGFLWLAGAAACSTAVFALDYALTYGLERRLKGNDSLFNFFDSRVEYIAMLAVLLFVLSVITGAMWLIPRARPISASLAQTLFLILLSSTLWSGAIYVAIKCLIDYPFQPLLLPVAAALCLGSGFSFGLGYRSS